MTSHTMHYVYTILPALVATAMGIQAGDSITRAQALRSNGAPVVTAPDGNIYCEAEEFQVEGEQPRLERSAMGRELLRRDPREHLHEPQGISRRPRTMR